MRSVCAEHGEVVAVYTKDGDAHKFAGFVPSSAKAKGDILARTYRLHAEMA